ncbi:MAG: hypothetical protein RJA49_527 [Actinomycetota bacterium]
MTKAELIDAVAKKADVFSASTRMKFTSSSTLKAALNPKKK